MAGGKSPSVVNRGLLLQRIKSCRHKCSTVDDIVDHLQSTYRDYRALKKLPFTSIVQQTLNKTPKSIPSSPNKIKRQLQDSKNEDADCSTIGKKRAKRGDLGEQRLQNTENMHLKRIQHNNQDGSSSSLSSSSDFGNSGDGAVSTSEDAIYGEKVEPKFDLMKSMLRTSYAESKKLKNEHLEKSMELEVAIDDKVAEKIIMGNEGNANKEILRKEKQSSLNGEEIEGPWFKDLGGMKSVLDELKMEVIVPLYHPQLPLWLGVRPMAGILLHGPPGCGKTKLAHAIANETRVPFYKISATEIVSGVSGASEENIRELFSKAYRTAPSIVFIDEIDAIASKRENLQREMERRIVTQLMTCMDGFHKLVDSKDASSKNDNSDVRPGYVLVIGATNRPDAVDPALRRPGRFDREIVLGVPDENARAEILTVLTSNLRLEGSFDLLKIARATAGFVGADLTALANKAGNLAMKRIIDQRKCELSTDFADNEHIEDWWRQPWLPEEMEKLAITMTDFEEAIQMVQPSLRREGFSAIPSVKWEDVGGLEQLRAEFDRYVVRRVKYPEDYEGFGVDLETGFLLYGPPGCGKTLIAKAVANEAGANFIHIKGPELLNKYVGESELAVRTLFSRARACSPCILFFDEVDALTTKRGKEGGWVVERLLNQLLIELDGAEQRRGVFVIGATNRPEVIDPAILRPGRFGKLLYVPLPNPTERGLVLKALGRKKPIDVSVDLLAIGQMEACENFSGADLAALFAKVDSPYRDKLSTIIQFPPPLMYAGNPFHCFSFDCHFALSMVIFVSSRMLLPPSSCVSTSNKALSLTISSFVVDDEQN
ncbi:cell division control protein 48-like protein C-like [Cucumis melo var. makuwa]|uniref:Cell division control protein 48-like protein C-like n=1 Tax=Cucumis melo var. makuwa TaxID=1194695 RepID=A0A5A7T3P0_CUCMM|nr:cell division control protein 48-like protein C-like [Cucumis melo var. makuwa]